MFQKKTRLKFFLIFLLLLLSLSTFPMHSSEQLKYYIIRNIIQTIYVVRNIIQTTADIYE